MKPAQEDGEDHFSEDDYDDDMSDEIAVAHSRKMKRTTKKTKATRSAPSLSPTRELPDINDLEDAGLTSDDESIESHVPAQGLQLDNHVTVHLTINIPLNHKGPITLNLDPKACMPAPSDRLSQIALARINARSKSSKSKSVGFLDLPAELKNVIYREIFVSDSPLSFGRPTSFSRTSALLRTCKQVYVCDLFTTNSCEIRALDPLKAELTPRRKKDAASSTRRTRSLLKVEWTSLGAYGRMIGGKRVILLPASS